MDRSETIIKIDELYNHLKTLLPPTPQDEKRLWEKLRLEFNYNSNHIEGNTLTYGQTKMLLLFDKSIGDAPVSDLEEMKAHDVAFIQIKQFAAEANRPLTEQFIRELNNTILVKSFWKEAITPDGSATRKKIEIGTYKTTPNSVQLKNGRIHEYASPQETPIRMQELVQWYRANENTMHPVRLAAEFHYRFVCIHPFDDGNGRVARLVMNYILLNKNIPPVVIKSEDKEAYLTALQKADAGDLEAFIDYIALQLKWSIGLSIKAAKGEELAETGDIEKEIAILKREKLTNVKIFRTPKNDYELTVHIKDNVIPKFEKALSKFDDFFSDSKTDVSVNNTKIVNTKIIYEGGGSLDKLISLTPKRSKVEIKKYELWEHDFEQEAIRNISWKHQKLSLKSASKKTDYVISFDLIFKDDGYEFNILINSTSIFHDKKEYKSFYMNDDIEKIIHILSTHLLQIIKETK